MKNKLTTLLLFITIIFSSITEILAQKTLSYLALGDSYTIGESVNEKERWPAQLVRQLNQHQYSFASPTIIAKTAWRTDDLIDAITEKNRLDEFHLVSLQIGVNNQYQDQSIEDFKKDLHRLIPIAISLSREGSKGVFALSIPDYGVTPFAQSKNPEQISKEIELFNSAYKAVCEEYQIVFYNITPISRKAAHQTDLLATDGLHPSGLMYQQWVDLLFEEGLLNLLTNQNLKK